MKYIYIGFPGGAIIKNPPADLENQRGNQRDSSLIPGQEDTLEQGMTTSYSILAWRIP